jgi:hypothetical protein
MSKGFFVFGTTNALLDRTQKNDYSVTLGEGE